jgi:hypothetical protein
MNVTVLKFIEEFGITTVGLVDYVAHAPPRLAVFLRGICATLFTRASGSVFGLSSFWGCLKNGDAPSSLASVAGVADP